MNLEYWALGISVTVVLVAITFAYRYGKWQGEADSDRQGFSKFIEEIRKDIKDILGRLPPSPTTSANPIKLTEIGERMSRDIDAKVWAAKIANEMANQTKDMDSLEIQEESFKKAKNFQPNESLLQKMRDSAFQEGINLDGVRDVLGVGLRDHLLVIHGKTKNSLDR